MVRQYPYTLQTQTSTAPTRNSDGDWVGGGVDWVDYSKCRDEDGTGRLITMPDGQTASYSFLIQLPRGTAALEAGRAIRVVEPNGVIRAEGVIKYSRKDQLHTRAWV